MACAEHCEEHSRGIPAVAGPAPAPDGDRRGGGEEEGDPPVVRSSGVARGTRARSRGKKETVKRRGGGEGGKGWEKEDGGAKKEREGKEKARKAVRG
jgi:hypothetical protein